jgi:hypothetical protein
MKQEFKKGDPVLVRDSDAQEWVSGVFKEASKGLFHVINNEWHSGHYYQCRHIDDFRADDKVQVRNSENYEWRNAIYAVYVPNAPFQHWVFPEDMDSFSLDSYALCRWHPSMPWAEKEEPLTLEQRVEALERKLNEQ